jgi:hypothetical protein
MSRTILAAALALLAVTAPARAATITTEDINIDFGNGYQAFGQVGFLGCCSPLSPSPNQFRGDALYSGLVTVSLNGAPLTWDNLAQGLGDPFQVLDYELPLPSPLHDFLVLTLDTPAFEGPAALPTSVEDFTLGWGGVEAVGVSGSVTCVSGSGCLNTAPPPTCVGRECELNAAPLPPALPLFATGIAGLGLIGWRKRAQGQKCMTRHF